MYYRDHALSVRPSLTFHIFDFSETAEQNLPKLERKQELDVLYQVCAFRADRKYKMAALASGWLRHFRLLLWNLPKLERVEARTQRPLPSLYMCFSGRSEKQDWLIFDFRLLWIRWTKLDGKQELNVLYQDLVCIFRADRKLKITALADPSRMVAHCTRDLLLCLVFIPPPLPFERGAYCFALVGWYYGLP